MKVLLIPDSFKGSLSATKVSEALAKGIRAKFPQIEILKMPFADGGEGSLEAINYVLRAEEIFQSVKDPLWRTTQAFYLKKEDTCYIELAQAAGLQLVKEAQRDPELATTYGTGQQLKHAVRNGARRVFLFAGGSATNDAGIGIAQAMGYKFLDKEGRELLSGGEALSQIETIRPPENLPEFDLYVLCDVQNPLYGKNGAAWVYASQKGADEKMVKRLDAGLRNFSGVIEAQFGIQVADISGAGAAGGVPVGMVAFFGAKILPGTETLLDITELERQLINVDLIITGEGKLDQQTLSGKLISGIAQLGQKHNIPVDVICGANELTEEEFHSLGVRKVISLVDNQITPERAMQHTASLLEEKVSLFF
jgi:glycerate kinase